MDAGTNTSLPAQGHLCFCGQVTKRFYVIPQRLFSQQDTSCRNWIKVSLVRTAHEHLARVSCIKEPPFCYATSHPKCASALCLGHRNTAFRVLLHNSASTLGGTCTALPAFCVHCLSAWETQECCGACGCAEVWPLWEPGTWCCAHANPVVKHLITHLVLGLGPWCLINDMSRDIEKWIVPAHTSLINMSPAPHPHFLFPRFDSSLLFVQPY